MFYPIDDLRIKWTKVVLPPVFLEEEMPTTETASATVHQARHEICEILGGRDRRLLVVTGPCSIHDTDAAREYAGLLQRAIAEFSTELRIVMRVYFEKPRTTVGWKGLINDPSSTSPTKSMTACGWHGGCCWTWRKWECPPEPSSST